MANTSKKNGTKGGKKKGGHHMVAIGVAAGAVLAGLAGAYYMQLGHSSKKKSAHHKSLAYRIKAEVLEGIEKAGHTLNKQNFSELVDNVMRKYQDVSDFTKSEYTTLSKEMKSLWSALHNSYEKLSAATGSKSSAKGRKTK